MNNNKSNNTLKIVLIVIGSVVGAIIAFVCVAIFLVGMLIRGGANAISEHNQREDEEARSKTFTTYYDESEVVSARYFYTEKGQKEWVWVEIPEDRVEDLVDDLDSLQISKVGGMKDYFYGWQNGIEITYENGNRVRFDGERIEYYIGDSTECRSSIFMYFEEGKEAFWEILSDYTVDGRTF